MGDLFQEPDFPQWIIHMLFVKNSKQNHEKLSNIQNPCGKKNPAGLRE